MAKKNTSETLPLKGMDDILKSDSSKAKKKTKQEKMIDKMRKDGIIQSSTEDAIKEAQKAQERRNFLRKYYDNKRIILELEQENLEHIFLLKSNDDYYKMFGNSAIIYAMVIAPRRKVSAKINIDSDNNVRTKDGVVSIRKLDKFNDTISDDAELDKEFCIGDEIIAYRLKTPMSKAEISGLRKKQRENADFINRTIRPKESHPEATRAMNDFLQRTFMLYRKSGTKGKNKLLEPILNLAVDLKNDYRLYSEKMLSDEDWKESRTKKLLKISSYIDILVSVRMLSQDEILNLVFCFSEVRRLVPKGKDEDKL